MTEVSVHALRVFEVAVLVYFVFLNGFSLLLLVGAAAEVRHHRTMSRLEERWSIVGSEVAPTLTILAPAYDEGATVAQSVRALLTLRYPGLEVVLINDGSQDDTLDVLVDTFELGPVFPILRERIDTAPVRGIYRSATHPGLVVIDKENGGKADALNVGLNVARGELVCAVDADTLIEPDALLRMARPFLGRADVVAAGGTIRVANGSTVRAGRVVEARTPRSFLPGMQAVEYLRAFLFGRLGWNRLGGNLIISGAFGLFRREAVLDCGGYLLGTVGEDMELVVRLRRRAAETGGPGRVQFVPDPVAWTETPTTLAVLGRQRDRWHRGLAEVLWRHRRCIGNPRYGTLGLVATPYFVVVELLGPVVEAIGVIGLVLGLVTGVLDVSFALLFFLVAYGFALVLDAMALLLDEIATGRYLRLGDRLVLIGWCVLENLGYRQLTVWWRLRGLIGFVRKRSDWGAMERQGFAVHSDTG